MPPAKKSTENAPKTLESAQKSAENVQPAKSKDAVGSALGLVGPTVEFLKSNFVSLFVKMLKVEFTVLLVNAVLLGVAGLVAVGILAAGGAPLTSVDALVDYALGNRMLLALTVVWFLAAELAISWMGSSIAFTAYPIVKEQFEGAYSGIWRLSGKIRFRVLGYVLLNFVITAVFLGIPMLLLFLLMGHPTIFWISMVVFFLYAIVFILAYVLLSQFWRWELTMGEKQAYEALASSVSLVKGNLFGVIVYDAVAVLGYVIIAVPFVLLLFGLNILFQGAALAAMLVSPFAYLAVLGVSALVRALITSLNASLSNSVLFPYTYQFWNGLRKKQ